MLEALSTPRNRTLTIVFLAACGALAAAAATVGISDNPPGILLAFISAAAFLLAFVHPWRTVRQFARLLGAAAIGLVLFALLHNVFEAVASKHGGAGPLRGMLEGIGVAAFLLAVLVCPPAIFVSAVGMVSMAVRNRRRLPRGGDVPS
jgi:hypothetical protein